MNDLYLQTNMIGTRDSGSSIEDKRRNAKRASSRWKQRSESRKKARTRPGAVRKPPPAPAKKPDRHRLKMPSMNMPRVSVPPVGRILSGLGPDNTTLPGWRDISKTSQLSSRPQSDAFLERISTGRFVVMLLLVALAATLYIGHVHATQTLVADLEQAKRQNMELHLQHNRLRGDFDRLTGPAILTERARALDLEEGVAYRPAITINTNDSSTY